MGYDRVQVDPDIMYGKPVVRGTRIPVELILHRLRFHKTIQGVVEEYPDLSVEDVQAAVDFAASHLPGTLIAAE